MVNGGGPGHARGPMFGSDGLAEACARLAVGPVGAATLGVMTGQDAVADNGKPIESVWDYPRPPRLEPVPWRIRVVVAGVTVADAPDAIRILETSQAPAYYVAPDHVDQELLRASANQTFCEWKGLASYADVVVDGQVASGAAWTYRQPNERFAALADRWAFYAQAVDECWVDDERVDPNEGDFYGGWITANLRGPFKGAPGTRHW